MDNSFIAMCKFGANVRTMTLTNCNLFKRSFTDKGIGFTFNNEKEADLIKQRYKSEAFFPNTDRKPSLMISADSKHALKVVLENNAEDVKNYEFWNQTRFEPTEVTVSLHNPKEPADVRSRSFNIPLGYSTKVYITPKAREIDENGKLLTESQRNCRLDEDTESLNIFNIYTKAACMLECKIKYSFKRCGCLPWNYPHNTKVIFKIIFHCFFCIKLTL